MADVQEVPIAAMNLLAAGRYWNSAALGIGETILARLQIPFAPRCNDFQLWSKCLISVLKAHLIVALAGAAMRNGGRVLLERNFHLVLGDHRTCERRPEQILVLIYS